jgi:hypothetical protein
MVYQCLLRRDFCKLAKLVYEELYAADTSLVVRLFLMKNFPSCVCSAFQKCWGRCFNSFLCFDVGVQGFAC